MSSAMGARVRHVKIVVHSTLVGDIPRIVELWIDGKLEHTQIGNGVIDPVSSMLLFLEGYMNQCTHKPMCVVACNARERMPFTLDTEREWSNE